MWSGLRQYREGANFAQGIKQALAPVAPFAQRANIPPLAFVDQMSRGIAFLADPRQSMADRQAFGLDMLRRLGIEFAPGTAEAGEGDNGQPGAVDIENHPVVRDLRRQLGAVITRIQTGDEQMASEVRANLETEVSKFASDPAHPYFYEVADDIIALWRGGAAKTLQEAYEKAVMANPATRAKELQRLTDEAVNNARKADAEKAAAARQASGANVTKGQQRGRPTAPASGSMEDTMRSTLKAIRERE